MAKKNKLGKSVDYGVATLLGNLKDGLETQALNYDLAYVQDTSSFMPFFTDAEATIRDNVYSACMDALAVNTRGSRHWRVSVL